MNKEDFLGALQVKLSGLPREDVERSLEFYGEAVDDRIESGLTEEEAVDALGAVDEIAEQILADTPLPKLIRAKVTPARSLKAWEIILLALGSPVWLPLILAAAVTGLAIYATLWSVLAAAYAVVLALALSGVAVLIGQMGQLLFVGLGLVLLGVSILLFFVVNAMTKGIIFVSKKYVLHVKSLLRKKGEQT